MPDRRARLARRICTIAQHIYKEGEFNPDNKCQLCDPSQSYETWSNAALGQACNPDNLECTADVCDGSGTCFHPLTTGCLIGGNCVADGALSGRFTLHGLPSYAHRQRLQRLALRQRLPGRRSTDHLRHLQQCRPLCASYGQRLHHRPA